VDLSGQSPLKLKAFLHLHNPRSAGEFVLKSVFAEQDISSDVRGTMVSWPLYPAVVHLRCKFSGRRSVTCRDNAHTGFSMMTQNPVNYTVSGKK